MTPSARPAVLRIPSLALLLSLVAVAWYGQRQLQYGSPRETGAWILAAALAAVVALLLGITRASDPRGPTAPPPTRPSGLERLAVAALIALGVLFRFIHFGSVPEGLNHDAAWYGMYAIYIGEGAPYTPYVAAGFGRETLYMYIVAPFVQWLGNTQEALQLASSLCGVAALVPFYLLARAMFGTRVALIGLAFLAVSGWHGVFSRVGWRVVIVPPFEMLALYAAWRAVQGGRWRAWLLMGAGAALSIYTYNAARIVPLLSALLYLLHVPWRRRDWRRYATGGLVALATFLLVGLPMLWYAAIHFDDFQRRLAAVSEQRDEEGGGLLHNGWAALGLFNYRGNGDDFFIDEPLLEPLAAVAFLLGAAVALRRVRQRVYAFVALGLAVALLPGLLSVPNGNRGITAIPFVYLLVAVGLDTVLSHAAALLPRGAQRVGYRAAVAIAVAVAAFESYSEFLGPDRRPLRGISPGATGGAQFVRRHRDRYRPYTISNWTDNTFIYLTHRPGDGPPFEVRWPFGTTLEEVENEIDRRGDMGLMFLLDFGPSADAALHVLAKRFPDHRIEPIPAPRGAGAAVGRALFVEAGAVARPWRNFGRSLLVRNGAGDSAAGATLCGEVIGDGRGVSAHVSLMVPQVDTPVAARIGLLRSCPPEPGEAPLATVGLSEKGVIAATDREETLIPFAELEAGRWYDLYASVRSNDAALHITAEGAGTPVSVSLPVAARAPQQLSGIDVRLEPARDAAGAIYLDDVQIFPGAVGSADPAWSAARAPYRPSGGGVPPPAAPQDDATMGAHFDFDGVPFGPLDEAHGGLDVVGTVAVVNSPRAPGASHTTAAGNAFVGGKGRRPAEFAEPMGVAVDGDGNFYVTERLGDRLQKFAPDGSSLATWGRRGDGPGEFHEPMDAAADDTFLYVVDSWNHRVQVFDWNGTPLFEFRGFEPSLYGPRGIAARHGKIYVADSGNGIVRVFDRSGAQLMTMGEKGGDGPGHLIEPVDVDVGAAGRVYVVNSGNNRIEVFRPDGSADGSFPIRGWQGQGLKEGYLTIDAGGIIYLSDPQSGQIRRFTTDGDELPPVAGEVGSPAGLSAAGDRLLVSVRFADHVHAVDLP